VRWPVIIRNGEQTNEIKITEQITRCKWNWIGHTFRKEEAMEWNPQGQRKSGRPKRSWKGTIQEEVLAAGNMWGEIKQLSKNHMRWRHFVNALCSSGC
jgi:hypothetical protein